TILTGLRRELEAYLIITRQTLAFNHAAPYWLDVAEFERELAQLQPALQAAPPFPPETTRRLQAPLDLYRGDFLATFSLREGAEFEAWVLWRQEQLKRLASVGLHRLGDHYLATGDYHQGLTYAEKWLALDPYNDAAQRQVMELLVRCGQPHLALQRYQRFRQLLAQELGLDPAPETSRLYTRIHAARALSSANLPQPDTPFVGRAAELEQIRTYLANPLCRLVTLIGPGGTGKTRLALEAARRQQQSWLHGVCFVPLADQPSADSLMLAVAGALDLSLHGIDDSSEQVLTALHEREMLLVLDNFEPLLAPTLPSPQSSRNGSKSGLAWLTDILNVAPEVKILITSRERLNLVEERVFQVEGLPQPNEAQAESDLSANSAVQLFVQSARQVQPSFSPTPADLAEIGRICRLVNGLPLALKLAAAWVRAMTCGQIAAEIDQDLNILQSSARNVLPRQRSIQAVFDHSWRLLTPAEQQILAQLSVFRGGLSLEAARRVAGADLPALARLVDKSWLTLNALGRYEWHELLRRYAAAKLGQDGVSAGAEARHAEMFALFLKNQQASLENQHQVEALAAVTTELDNVRVAWDWAITQHRFELIRAAVDSVWVFYEIKNWFQEGEEMFRRAVAALTTQAQVEAPSGQAAVSESLPRRLLAQLLIRQGWFLMRLARFEPAQAHLQEGLTLARQAGDFLEIGRALHHLGVVTNLVGHYSEAKQYLEESLFLYHQHGGNHFDLGSAVGTLGLVFLKTGQFEQARPLIEDCKRHYLQTGNPRAIALIYSFFGGFSIQIGDFGEAKRLLAEGLAFQKLIDDRIMIRMSLAWLGEVHEMLAEYDEARQQYEESLLVSRANGDRLGMAIALNGLGRVYLALDQLQPARHNFREALGLTASPPFFPLLIDGLVGVAALLVHQGNRSQALEILSVALAQPACEPQTRSRAEQLLSASAALSAVRPETPPPPAEALEALVAMLLATGSILES
ncbi:MAG TPA: BTAD domain-containing putative transcriptional regulator, partial [Anaerolineae bacterium]|nr:BTAD domain-containing putative transcriptional regulator [Anaerolineae bacterium]